MSQTATSSDAAASLIVALEQNEFDIAGLADFCAEQKCVEQCLRRLHQIIGKELKPNVADKALLAQVIVGMLYVARHDYAADGHQEYWPYLFERIRKASFADLGRFWGDVLSEKKSEKLLGDWFRFALNAFGYSIPNEGQKFVGPIVFHAGIPSSSLPRVMSVIASSCDQFGPQAISLPADIRSELVSNQFLHRNVERLFSSNLQGAAQLWGCLARVVLAWKTLGDCSEELQQLPLALDPDEVLAALPSKSEAPRVPRTALPQLRYDSETGEIRLIFPGDGSMDWKVSSGGQPVELSWFHTHLGKTAEFNGPLPQQILVEPAKPNGSMGRVFTPYPSEWEGFWFHAHNGNLEDGRLIDASGLTPGRWYVVFEGTPSKCSVPFIAQIQLKWSWFRGNRDWTAWEVEVPPRSSTQTHLEWFIGDNRFRVPLSRRPGPRVEFVASPLANATTSDGNRLDVYAKAPTVILRRESPISVQLLRESTDSVEVVTKIDLKPETATVLPVVEAGVYQLRESRGVGRTLLRFAIVPELTVQGPEYDAQNQNATVRISADRVSGQIICDGDYALTREDQHWKIESTTVEPSLRATWSWSNDVIPNLTFRWSLEGMRWRITQAGDDYAEWTRQPLFISPKKVAERDAQLEIQTPAGSDLRINGKAYAGKQQTGASGSTCRLSLLPYDELVELENEGQRYAAVIKSERPLIDFLQGESDTKSVIVTWQSEAKQAGMVVVAWDPCDVMSTPKTFALSNSELESHDWATDCAGLPGHEWTSISLARSVGGFFKSVFHLAARRSEALEPIALLLNRSTGEIKLAASIPTTWPEFLHHITLLRLNQNVLDWKSIAKLLSDIISSNQIDLTSLIRLVAGLERQLAEPTKNDRDRNWAHVIHRAALAILSQACRDNPSLALSGNSVSESFHLLLRHGVPIGQFCPFRWIASGDPPAKDFAYPLTYIYDLWLLGTVSKLLEYQVKQSGETLPLKLDQVLSMAAGRVLDFHKRFDLPSITSFLPLSRPTATTNVTDREHHHSFALPPLPSTISDTEEFCGILGIGDKGLDCQATCDDQFFGMHSHSGKTKKSGYSLYWCAEENRWAIETLNSSTPTCCYTKTEPLLVGPIPARELASSTVIKSLAAWAREEVHSSEQIAAFKFLDNYKEHLETEPTSGPLHAEIFRPTETAIKELFGQVSCEVVTRAGLSPLAMIAWQLAWIERTSAWKSEGAILEPSDEPSSFQREFLSALAVALAQWPKLMQRTLALAELVYWTLYRGGIGTAVKFQSEHTENLLVFLETLHQEHERTFVSSASTSTTIVNETSEVLGIIVRYHEGIGEILLQHPSSPSLEATLQDYVKNGNANQHRFARFKWHCIPEVLRNQIQKHQSQGSSIGDRARSLADVMCGIQVKCKLQDKSERDVAEMTFNPNARRSHIPKWLQRKIS